MLIVLVFFFFKQKTAYEMRISDWSSDVCSSDLAVSIERASETARAGDRDIIETASAVLRASIASIDGVVEQAWAADRQLKQLVWAAAGAFGLGAFGTIALSLMIS